jgi:hypothetical protein
MKLYPYFDLPYQIYLDEAYSFFKSNYIQQFIVDIYKNMANCTIEAFALPLTYEYNGYTIVLLIDYNDSDLYSIQIDNNKLNSFIKIKKDFDSICKAICDIKNCTLPLIRNGTSNTDHINLDLYNYVVV